MRTPKTNNLQLYADKPIKARQSLSVYSLQKEALMTKEMQLRCQFALAIVDSIWLKGKITDEERLKARLIVVEKFARLEEKKKLLEKYKK